MSDDPLGRLYQLSKSGITTRFQYDGSDLIAEYDGSNNLLRRYVHGPGTDNPIIWYEGSGISGTTRRFLMADERGSIVSVTDSANATIGLNAYDDHGVPAAGNIGRFGYTGQAWLPEVGLRYYKARMYSPTLGRFMQTDPIGYADGMNWYNYVGGDPVNGSDPAGLCARDEHLGTETGSRIPKCLPNGVASADGRGSGSAGAGSSGSAGAGAAGSSGLSGSGFGDGASGSVVGGDDIVVTATGHIFIPRNSLSFGPPREFSLQYASIGGDNAEIISQVLDNAALGRKGEAEAIRILSREGYRILGQHIYVRTTLGLRITDFLTTKRGDLVGWEVKTGLYAKRSGPQEAKDYIVENNGGIFIGRGAIGGGIFYGQIVKYPTGVLSILSLDEI